MSALTVISPRFSTRLQELRAKLGRPQFATIASFGAGPTYNPETKAFGDRVRWIEHASRGLRVSAANDCIESSRSYRMPRGYYVDSFQSDTTAPAVIQMPARDGEPRYFAATSDPWNADCYIVAMDPYSDAAEAARAAHHIAESYAESCRDDDIRWHAERQIEECRETITRNRTKARALMAELRHGPRVGAATCDALREHVARLRAESRDARDRIETLIEEPWRAVPC